MSHHAPATTPVRRCEGFLCESFFNATVIAIAALFSRIGSERSECVVLGRYALKH